MSRRLILCALAGVSLLAAGTAIAQAPPAAPAPAPVNWDAIQIKATDLGNRTWMLEGNGGNMMVVAGDDGVILVDTEFAPLHNKIVAAVKALSPQPIRFVVNTHMHGDHTGGNTGFWLEGVPIVAHANLKAGMERGVTNALSGARTPPALRSSLPTRTYAGPATNLAVKGRSVQLVYMRDAHTHGDSAVWAGGANAVATGDIVSTGARWPNIDVGDGGGVNGVIAAVDAFLRRADANTKIVPGHGALMTKTDLQAYRTLMVESRDAVAKAKAAGMTEQQMVDSKPLAALQARAGATDQQSVNFARLIYKSLP